MSRSEGLKNRRIKSRLRVITRPVAAFKSIRFALFCKDLSLSLFMRTTLIDSAYVDNTILRHEDIFETVYAQSLQKVCLE